MSDDKMTIKLHMYDVDMSVTINRDDEVYYRRAGKRIDDRVNRYAKTWKGKKSDNEILYMALLDIALRYEKESTQNDTAPYRDILSKLTSVIEEALK